MHTSTGHIMFGTHTQTLLREGMAHNTHINSRAHVQKYTEKIK